MKKNRIFLMLGGCTPFILGYAFSYLMQLFSNYLFPYILIGIAFLCLWYFFGRIVRNDITLTLKEKVIFANIPAFFVLVLILYQELILGQYGLSFWGVPTQMFYLPLIGLASMITSVFRTVYVFFVYIIAFLLMCGVFYMGCRKG